MSRTTAYFHNDSLELRGEASPEAWIVTDSPVEVEE